MSDLNNYIPINRKVTAQEIKRATRIVSQFSRTVDAIVYLKHKSQKYVKQYYNHIIGSKAVDIYIWLNRECYGWDLIANDILVLKSNRSLVDIYHVCECKTKFEFDKNIKKLTEQWLLWGIPDNIQLKNFSNKDVYVKIH